MNLLPTLFYDDNVSGFAERVYLDKDSYADIINVTAIEKTRMRDFCDPGCYIGIMAHNDAYNLSYPEFPAKVFENKYIATLMLEPKKEEVIELPRHGRIQAIRMQFPINHAYTDTLVSDDVDPFLKPFKQYVCGWTAELTGELMHVSQQVWKCNFVGIPRQLWLQGKMRELLALMMLEKSETKLSTKACKLIEAKPDFNWSIKSLAFALGTNDCYLKRAFKEELGVGVAAWIRRFRVEQAKAELMYSNKSITQIAIALGFTSSSHFGKVFKEFNQVPPREFRENHKKRPCDFQTDRPYC